MDHKKSFLHVKVRTSHTRKAVTVKGWPNQWPRVNFCKERDTYTYTLIHIHIHIQQDTQGHTYSASLTSTMSNHRQSVSSHHTLAWGYNYQRRISQLEKGQKTGHRKGKKEPAGQKRRRRERARTNLRAVKWPSSQPTKVPPTHGQDKCT